MVYLRYLLACLLLFNLANTRADEESSLNHRANELIIKMERELETWRHDLLRKAKATPGLKIRPFTTDGCSGGLSDGWYHMARVIPAFKKSFGDKPPWESCCVTHDRAYWQGDTDDGFEKRLQADEALQQCVVDFGKEHADEYAQQFDLDRSIIETNFNITAALMYRAVRVGGQPCTIFPWRWGYGWPDCNNTHVKDGQ